MKQQFRQASGIPGIVGCIDGTHVQIQAPSEHEYLYVNRKGYHSINVQVACDARYYIFNLVARWPGYTHDARILRESALYQEFEAERVTGLLLGDSGYPLTRWLMTPMVAPRTQQERRFHCLHGEMRMQPERVCSVVAACTVLHNICITKRIPLPRQHHQPVQEEEEHPAVPVVWDDIGGRLVCAHLINTLSSHRSLIV
ncbi:putative nuclease HARBI1 isoform X2 [Epinephelus moara]|uniref:putative nuclease HARBI1 isoform X2 n=1 Tax=Epinephelus moara TaxID=300413 RepID=UPI00214EA8FB|nr:putative nuclease HARBI1 isoform X2 [Epinephelus moara]